MQEGIFYFLKNSYFERFPDCGLMQNKSTGSRPCYYCMEFDGLYWMVPISSKIEKYERILLSRKGRYKDDLGIKFGYVNGRRSAFLLQNMCPVTTDYVDQEYRINKGADLVKVSKRTEDVLRKATRQILRLSKKGIRVTLTDIDRIASELKRDL